MTDRDVYLSATGCSAVRHIETDASYGKFSSSAVIECDGTSLTMGSAVTIDAGYTDQHQNIFEGYVQKIEYIRPDNMIRISCFDRLIQAANYFLASDDPAAPFQRNNISTPDLVADLLTQANITSNVFLDDPGFTWGTNDDGVRFNLQSVADAITFICNVTGYTIYAGTSGHIHFISRKPYPESGDTATYDFQSGDPDTTNVLKLNYSVGTDRTRNVVKVYGRTPLKALATATNSYLVVDQAVVIAHDMLDTQALCDGTASVNLELLNHLTENIEMTAIGDPSVKSLSIATITDVFAGLSGRKIFLYRVAHSIDAAGGYYMDITAIPEPGGV